MTTADPYFGAFPWQSVKSTPNPMHNVIIYRAQSLLSKNGRAGPILPYDEALEVVRKAEQETVK